MIDPTKRFSSRVEDYVKYRPGYPDEILNYLSGKLNLNPDHKIADIGSGTGIFTELLLKNDFKVTAVEPNDEMRNAAGTLLKEYPGFFSRKGTAEQTNLENDSIDFIFSAQAFHWFNIPETKKEFQRILRKNGYVVLIWNTRDDNSSDFMKAYLEFIEKNATDYQKVTHTNITDEKLRLFFRNYNKREFHNSQRLDFDGLKGRILSSSYMPFKDHPSFSNMIKDLDELFFKYNSDNFVELIYKTEVYYGRL